jgi:hypothetical protein
MILFLAPDDFEETRHMQQLPIVFRLSYSSRHDEQAKAYVAYIPLLRLFAQAKTEDRLKAAVHDVIVNWVTLCHQRGILSQVMHERGLKRVTVDKAHAVKEGEQYIMVGNMEKELYEVPATLLAGKQALAECH